MYNNAIIQSNYKPYIPPPKKKAVKNNEEKSSQQNSKTVTPNNYGSYNQQKQSSTSADSFTKHNVTPQERINIKQLLIDFNSTLNAIGASEDVEAEVKTYLSLVENQSQRDNPNKKMMISNLRIAADVLDTYITDTLKKPSKVVKDWVEALLLQNIDFKADNNITKGAFESITGEKPQTAQLAEKKLAEKAKLEEEKNEDLAEQTLADKDIKETDSITKTEEKPIQNQEALELIEQADTYITTQPKEAMKYLSEAFTIAQSANDQISIAEIYSKIGDVQNNLNNLSQALDCFNASTKLAYVINNNSLKTHNHKSMGKIYDDAGYKDTAIAHYLSSVGIDGLLDDTDNQADTLNAIGKMYTREYAKNEAIDYYKDALELAKVKQNVNIMSDIFQNTAHTFENSGQNSKAMLNYQNAAKLSIKSGNKEDLAKIYEQAGDLMLNMNYKNRAGDLYKKSYRLEESLSNTENAERLRNKVMALNS